MVDPENFSCLIALACWWNKWDFGKRMDHFGFSLGKNRAFLISYILISGNTLGTWFVIGICLIILVSEDIGHKGKKSRKLLICKVGFLIRKYQLVDLFEGTTKYFKFFIFFILKDVINLLLHFRFSSFDTLFLFLTYLHWFSFLFSNFLWCFHYLLLPGLLRTFRFPTFSILS